MLNLSDVRGPGSRFRRYRGEWKIKLFKAVVRIDKREALNGEATRLRAGDFVEVRSQEEILKTLDREGRLDGMPFMPEMFSFCGQRFSVYKRAHKGCDTIFPTRSRRIRNAVHLETRCDGQAHGGCQAFCLIYWKEAWLKRLDEREASGSLARSSLPSLAEAPGMVWPCTEKDVSRAAQSTEEGNNADVTYVCQATRLPYASEHLSPWDLRQYLEDYASGNVDLGQWLRGFIYITYQNIINLGIGLGPALRWFYDRFQSLRGGLPNPRRRGKIPLGQKTPTGNLELQEGELVRVKSYKEILETCNVVNKNHGLLFDGEMVPYCGGTYRVKKRVTRIVNEGTGKMMEMKNPCVILEDVFCRGRYSKCRLFCPRSIYSFWRDIWLEKIEEQSSST